MKFTLSAAILTVLSANIIAEPLESLNPIVFAVKADKNMVIDGRDSETCYAKAQKTEKFRTTTGAEIPVSSQVRAVYDDEKVYFFYDCYDPADSPAQPKDSIELFINGNAKDRDQYYQLYAALDGTVFINQKTVPVKDPAIRKKFEFKIRRKGPGYCCEIAVARDLFDQAPDLLWRVNFNRSKSGKGHADLLSCWSVTGPRFHTPSRFGYMYLGEKEHFIKNYFTPRISSRFQEIQALAKKYPAAVAAEELAKLARNIQAFEQTLNSTPKIEAGKKILADLAELKKKMAINTAFHQLRDFGADVSEEDLRTLAYSDENTSVRQKWAENIRKHNYLRADKSGMDSLDAYIPEEFYQKIARGEINRNLYPKYSDRKAWTDARKSQYAARLIADADKLCRAAVPQLLHSNYRRFITDGNRSDYENLMFARRKNLATLALALCLTGNKDKYMPRLLDYTYAILEESSWCAPAHANWQSDAKKLLDTQPADLFASETGLTMALLYHILGEELDKYTRNLAERIRQETLKRTIYGIFYHPESAMMHWWYKTETASNWCVWCSKSNLIVTILLEKDPRRTADFIREFMRINAHYVACYPEDGYCDEGPSYYGKSGLQFFSSVNLLHKVSPGSMDKLIAQPKIRAIFEYIASVGIGKNHQVNYGDNSPYGKKEIDMALCGELLNSEVMKNIYPGLEFTPGSATEYLNAFLKILFDAPEYEAQKQKIIPFSCYKDRLAVRRSKGFSAAVKAGHNDELHNHNDLGNITVYYQDKPIIVDSGNERYTRSNFSAKRYTLWYTRGSGHNAPVFGKIEQLNGRKYQAKFLRADLDNITIDLGKAYPAEAGVKKFTRSVDFVEQKLTLTDDFQLTAPQPVVLTFITPCKVEKISDDTLRLGKVIMKHPGLKVRKVYSRHNKHYWKEPFNLIEMETTASKYQITFEAQ